MTDRSAQILSNIIRNSSETLLSLAFYGNQFTNKTIRLVAKQLAFCKKLSVFVAFCPDIKSFDADFVLAIDQLQMLSLVLV